MENITVVQELVNEFNEVNNIDCELVNIYGEYSVIVNEPRHFEFVIKRVREYSDVIVELPMLCKKPSWYGSVLDQYNSLVK